MKYQSFLKLTDRVAYVSFEIYEFQQGNYSVFIFSKAIGGASTPSRDVPRVSLEPETNPAYSTKVFSY